VPVGLSPGRAEGGVGSPLDRLTAEDLARLDGTLAAQGHGQWRLREAQQVLGLSAEEVYAQVRAGQLVAYRAHVGAHWEWRVSPAAPPDQASGHGTLMTTTRRANQHPAQHSPAAAVAHAATLTEP
jgi:hypothetical protein